MKGNGGAKRGGGGGGGQGGSEQGLRGFGGIKKPHHEVEASSSERHGDGGGGQGVARAGGGNMVQREATWHNQTMGSSVGAGVLARQTQTGCDKNG